MRSSKEHVLVRTTPAGQPLLVERAGREWTVAEEPLRWFERINWWEGQGRMPRGRGRVDVEVWRVQARLGKNPRSQLATLDLERDPQGGGWQLRHPGP
jgi:hypothetical protein